VDNLELALIRTGDNASDHFDLTLALNATLVALQSKVRRGSVGIGVALRRPHHLTRTPYLCLSHTHTHTFIAHPGLGLQAASHSEDVDGLDTRLNQISGVAAQASTLAHQLSQL
jgi:hypothetical protein